MNIPVIAGFASADSPPAPQSARDSKGGNDLFGDLLRGQLNATPPAPARSDARDVPQTQSSEANDNEPAAADDGSQTNTAPQSPDANKNPQKPEAANNGKKSDAKDDKDASKTDDEKTDANPQAFVHSNSAVATTVLAALAENTPPAAGEIGQIASDAAHANAGPAAPAAPTPPSPTPPTADAVPMPPVPGQGDPQTKSDKNGAGPFDVQITVTDDSNVLVSRPQAALAPVKPADSAAHDDAKPAANSDTTATPATAAPVGTKSDAAASPKSANGDKTDASQPGDARADQPQLVQGDPAQSHKSADTNIQTQPAANVAAAPIPAHANTPADPISQVQTLVNAPRAAAVPTASPATFDQVAVQITKAAADGLDKISIQLKPENLGRIDVQLQVTHDGRVNATIGAHHQDTLDLLQRDARSLERALNDAGLRADAGSLSFNLSGQGRDGMPPPYTAPASAVPAGAEFDPVTAPSAAGVAYNMAADRGGVDIRV